MLKLPTIKAIPEISTISYEKHTQKYGVYLLEGGGLGAPLLDIGLLGTIGCWTGLARIEDCESKERIAPKGSKSSNCYFGSFQIFSG